MDKVSLITLALKVISDRLITILALSMSCGLACYTMWAGDWTRVATLGIFVVFSYLIVKNKESSHGQSSQGQAVSGDSD
jgi:hypothetical protein